MTDPILTVLHLLPSPRARYFSFLGGGPQIPEGMSAEDQKELLEAEDQLARERDIAQREFLQEQEAQRVSQEEAQRKLLSHEEAARVAELERMETLGGDVVTDMSAATDEDTAVSDMFSSLAAGTGFVNVDDDDEEEAESMRPT